MLGAAAACRDWARSLEASTREPGWTRLARWLIEQRACDLDGAACSEPRWRLRNASSGQPDPLALPRAQAASDSVRLQWWPPERYMPESTAESRHPPGMVHALGGTSNGDHVFLKLRRSQQRPVELVVVRSIDGAVVARASNQGAIGIPDALVTTHVVEDGLVFTAMLRDEQLQAHEPGLVFIRRVGRHGDTGWHALATAGQRALLPTHFSRDGSVALSQMVIAPGCGYPKRPVLQRWEVATGRALGPPMPFVEGLGSIWSRQLTLSADGRWTAAHADDVTMVWLDGVPRYMRAERLFQLEFDADAARLWLGREAGVSDEVRQSTQEVARTLGWIMPQDFSSDATDPDVIARRWELLDLNDPKLVRRVAPAEAAAPATPMPDVPKLLWPIYSQDSAVQSDGIMLVHDPELGVVVVQRDRTPARSRTVASDFAWLRGVTYPPELPVLGTDAQSLPSCTPARVARYEVVIVDSKRRPIPNAEVELVQEVSREHRSLARNTAIRIARTDAAGRVAFQDVDDIPSTVRVLRPAGYWPSMLVLPSHPLAQLEQRSADETATILARVEGPDGQRASHTSVSTSVQAWKTQLTDGAGRIEAPVEETVVFQARRGRQVMTRVFQRGRDDRKNFVIRLRAESDPRTLHLRILNASGAPLAGYRVHGKLVGDDLYVASDAAGWIADDRCADSGSEAARACYAWPAGTDFATKSDGIEVHLPSRTADTHPHPP